MKKDRNKYPSESIEANIEDTGQLLTRSSRGSRIRRLILIVFAVLAVLAIALLGYFLIGEKRYSDQVKIAEKALAESNYAQAEADYLAAVNMKKRKVKAREGLAYVYAVEKKTNEAIDIYERLYDDTGKEEYRIAVREVTDGGLPSDPGILPPPILETFNTSEQEGGGTNGDQGLEPGSDTSNDSAGNSGTHQGDNNSGDPGGYVPTSGATDGKTRDIALVLDNSGSMSGDPIEEVKKATVRFGETVLGTTAKVGMIQFESDAEELLPLAESNDQIAAATEELYGMGGTNIGAGLERAAHLLSGSEADRKIIVLMTDGEPTDGMSEDELVRYASRLKEQGCLIYTLGFFSDMTPGTRSEPQRLLERMASEGCHYEVSSAADLKFFFGDIADQINGVRYNYIRIACPVDVKVSYNGETLSSARTSDRARTSFGTLTFEDAYDSSSDEGANAVKILRLLEGPAYDISIKGTGNGSMDYTIGFVDDNGEYSDMRYFDQIDIGPRTDISTVAKVSKETKMTVDYDGDGAVDKTYKAKASSHAQIVDNSRTVKVVLALCLIVYVAALAMIIRGIVRRVRRNTGLR